jgi:antitoxin CcdA
MRMAYAHGKETPRRPCRPVSRRGVAQDPQTGIEAGGKRVHHAGVLDMARGMNINLSQTLEDALRKRTQDERDRRFQDEHRAAIEAHNRFIEKHGIWGKKYRSW